MTTEVTPYSNIIIAVDFSDSSKKVAERAKTIAAANGAEMTLIHATEYLSPLYFGDEPVPSPDWLLLEDQLVDKAETSLQEFATEMAIENVPKIVLRGAPGHEIVVAARERGADLIVLGAHGRHGLQQLLGSTASSVVRHAPCDVLAVRLQPQE